MNGYVDVDGAPQRVRKLSAVAEAGDAGGAVVEAGDAGGAVAWRRIERLNARGEVADWVEVGECARCGRGVDRAFPVEYRTVRGRVLCRECSPALTDRLSRLRSA